jgi:prefoldin subunit 5
MILLDTEPERDTLNYILQLLWEQIQQLQKRVEELEKWRIGARSNL